MKLDRTEEGEFHVFLLGVSTVRKNALFFFQSENLVVHECV